MGKEFDFKSQICTDRFQSERLLALGLKKETADMFWWDIGDGPCVVISRPAEKEDREYGKVIPAWGPHRLIEMVTTENIQISFYKNQVKVWGWIRREEFEASYYDKPNVFDNIIDTIEELIKDGYFNKGYLEE